MTRLTIKYVDTWRFWVTALGVGFLILAAATAVSLSKQRSDEQRRDSDARAGSISQVTECYTGVKNAPVVNGVLETLQFLVDDKLQSLNNALKVQPDSSLNEQRRKSKVKTITGQKALNTFEDIVATTTPTVAKCRELAARVNVPWRDIERQVLPPPAKRG